MQTVIAAGLAFVLIVAASAPVPPRDERKDQQAAAELVERLGGDVLYDYQRPDPNRPHSFDPKLPPNEKVVPFHRVVRVGLAKTNVRDDDLRAVARLTYLENLDLTHTRVTNTGLAYLAGLKNLRVLGLAKTGIDDAGLAHLKGMTRMWQLLLDETGVTDAGLVYLKDMTGLEVWLGLSGTRVTDKGLKHLEDFKKLRTLTLHRTLVTVEGVEKLRAALPRTDVAVGR